MPHLTIDGHPVTVPAGTTILAAARQLGIRIPTLCHLDGRTGWHHAACMVCVVKINGNAGNLVPACARPAEDGQVIETDSPDVREARRGILEVMLSDHLGDCEGPCRLTCPAGMEIPAMMRSVAVGALAKALATVRRDIALPAVLGRICPEVCEKACRRRVIDQPVAICLVKRHVGDRGPGQAELPVAGPATGKRVAVVGAGPAGLAAAFHLRLAGQACTVFEAHPTLGGALRTAIPADRLPPEVLDAEIAVVRGLGVEFRTGVTVGSDPTLAQLRATFDAVFVAAGPLEGPALTALGLPLKNGKPVFDVNTLATPEPGLFAGGDLVRRRKLAIRSVADGKQAAQAISAWLATGTAALADEPFNSRCGKLNKGEALALALPEEVSTADRTVHAQGFTPPQAESEARRCLHCDCRRKDDCRLRELATEYGAKQSRFTGSTRRKVAAVASGGGLIYESGKCIACGKCVWISQQAGEPIGLTFVNRGFPLKVEPAFHRPLSAAVTTIAQACAAACPTGALVLASAQPST